MTIGLITTKRLTLCWAYFPAEDMDLCQIAKWLSDLDVVKYSEQRWRLHSRTSQHEYIGSFRWPNQYWLIHLDTKLIGTITANVDSNNSVADMGIMIGDKSEWGKGYGTEAWLGLMHHLFGMGIRKIEAGCMARNFGMKGIFNKSGMLPEGMRAGHFILDGTPVDMELWAKFNDR